MKLTRPLTVATLLTVLAVPAHAALSVNQDLGTLGIGDTANIVGDTSTGANNADIYQSAGTSNAANWGNELVFQFTVSSDSTILLQSNALTGDPDAFLLSGLGTVDSGGKNDATGGISFAFLDGAPPETAAFGGVFAGTYYISIDSFIGFDGGVTPADAIFDYTLSISALAAAPAAISLGVLGDESTPITIDSLGSLYDTELGLYDSLGNLLLDNDDIGGGPLQSELAAGPLAQGEYYVALGGFNTAYAPLFDAVGGGDAGEFALNSAAGTVTGTSTAGNVEWFSFSVVPEPGTMSLLALAGLGLFRRRRS